MTDRELTNEIATKVMGWQPYPTIHYDWGWSRPDGDKVFSMNWKPLEDRNAAAEVLEQIARKYPREFWHNLTAIIRAENPKVPSRWRLELGCIMAAPRQLCEAALKCAPETPTPRADETQRDATAKEKA